MEAKNATAVKATPTTTTTTLRSEPKIQMKRPAQIRPPMGLKESLIQITDQLRQGIKAETERVKMAKKPAPKVEQEDIIIYETSGHGGEALPLTMEDIEREMAQVEFQLQESTPKEGISTWILLSGTETTPQPNSNSNPKGPVYYTVPEKKMDSVTKVDKIMKVKDDKDAPVVLPKRRTSTTPSPIAKPRPKKTSTSTTTEAPTTTTEAPVTAAMKPIKKVKPESRVNVKRPRRPSTTTTSTTTEAPETTTEEEITEEPVEDSTFLIIEPKDSEFDLPNDRSPVQGKKKANINQKPKKTKKKPDAKPDKKKQPLEEMLEEIVSGVTGAASKKPGKTPSKKDKPMSTQIISYLSREVMPTVGVGLVGLLAAAGVATYFLGNTFTPLRRNDRTDEIYYNNNEEYAGPDGQYEEEWFSKVIAGSPTYRNNLRQAYKPAPAPAATPSMAMQQQANYAVHKYPQYSKYARPPPPAGGPAPGPQYNPNGPGPQYNPNHRNYNVRPNFAPQNYRINAGPMPMPNGANPSELVRKHSMAMPQHYPHHHYHPHAVAAQPPQTPLAAPVKESETKGYFSEASKRHSFSSSASEIVAEMPQESSAPGADDAVGPIEDNNFLKRTSNPNAPQFVVGSVYPEALTAKDPNAQHAESVPEHGPRRRRQLKKKTKKLDDNELDNENEMPIEELEKIANVEVATDKPAEESSSEHVTSSSAASTTTLTAEGVGKVETTTVSGGNYYETESVASYNATFGDFFRRMVQLKLKLGVSFLRGMADGVAKYLHQFEERLYRSTNYNTR